MTRESRRTQVVRYELGDGSVVRFEVEPVGEFAEASPERVAGRVRDAAGQAVKAAMEVLDQVRAYGPREVEVKFGIKVSGKTDWLVAAASTEGSFEVTLRWRPGPAEDDGDARAMDRGGAAGA
jgi:hypothetical protein